MELQLYDRQPYCREFRTRVISSRTEEGRHFAVLESSAFFPEQGGQYGDRGWIETGEQGRITVIDTQTENSRIRIETDRPLAEGAEAVGILDWADRYDKMQQHTAEHIISGIVCEKYKCHNVGFRLGPEHVTMDYDVYLTPEELQEVERAANEAVWKNLPVKVMYPSQEELSSITYRSKIEIEGQIRLVEIPGYDVCACCAPHVERTGEIGVIKIVGSTRYKGGVRVNMLCGSRALADYGEKQKNLREASDLLSVKDEMTAEAVARLQKENIDLRVALNAARRSLLEYRVRELAGQKPEGPLLLFAEGLEARDMQNAVNSMTAISDGYCGVFCGSGREGWRFVVGSRDRDSREAAAVLRSELSAKGGGSPQMVQGSLPAGEIREKDIRRVLEGISGQG